MTQPFSGFQVGGVVQPLSTSPGNSLLRDADPSVFYALEFFAFVISTYPGPRLVQAAAAAGVTAIAAAVAQKYPNLPQSEFLETQFQFPLLCVARKRTLGGRLTAGHERRRGLFDLLYVLPPLGPAQMELVLPILHAIEQTLGVKATQGFDPGYTPTGGAAGQSPWGPAFAGVQDVGFGDPYRDLAECTEYGFLEGTGNLLFPSLRMSGYFSERDNYNAAAAGAVKFAGADITADLFDGATGTVIDPFVQAAVGLGILTGIAMIAAAAALRPNVLTLVDARAAALTFTFPAPRDTMLVGITDVYGQSATHPITVQATGAGAALADPSNPGTFSVQGRISQPGVTTTWWIFVQGTVANPINLWLPTSAPLAGLTMGSLAIVTASGALQPNVLTPVDTRAAPLTFQFPVAADGVIAGISDVYGQSAANPIGLTAQGAGVTLADPSNPGTLSATGHIAQPGTTTYWWVFVAGTAAAPVNAWVPLWW